MLRRERRRRRRGILRILYKIHITADKGGGSVRNRDHSGNKILVEVEVARFEIDVEELKRDM